MTYLEFHLAFLMPPIVALAMVQRTPMGGIGTAGALKWIAVVCGIAFLYTTPWDNYLVYRGVWDYGPERVIGTIGYVPIEEYMFFILQPILTGLWYCLVRGLGYFPAANSHPDWFRSAYVGFWLLISIVGFVLLFDGNDSTLYMGLILAWCGPVLAGMSFLCANRFWRRGGELLMAISVPTVYLWVADRMAISWGIWDIADQYSLPFEPFGLPIEEAVFFLVTNLLVVQALIMFFPPNDLQP